MQRLSLTEQRKDLLLRQLAQQAPVFGPKPGTDGVVRWGVLESWEELAEPARLPMLPLKRWLLPSPELLWEERSGTFAPAAAPRRCIIAGVSPCDLAALAWLDQAGAEDPGYVRRRQELRVIGRACRPAGECNCPPHSVCPPFDLFLDDDWLWSGSPWGDALLSAMPDASIETGSAQPDTHAAGEGGAFPNDLEARFRAGQGAEVWRTTADRCLSCGACSAVCPTCNCFDVVDAAPLGASVQRLRIADNCFFRDHAMVAGGHNFRPDRTARLKFRFEHKLLGFGPLRGQVSCVGCGRCLRVCPARIDLREVLAALPAAAGGGA